MTTQTLSTDQYHRSVLLALLLLLLDVPTVPRFNSMWVLLLLVAILVAILVIVAILVQLQCISLFLVHFLAIYCYVGTTSSYTCTYISTAKDTVHVST